CACCATAPVIASTAAPSLALAPLRPHVDHKPPVGCCCRLHFAEPMEGIIGNLCKTPACQVARVGRAFLHDVRVARAADLLAEYATTGIEPGNPPRGHGGV